MPSSSGNVVPERAWKNTRPERQPNPNQVKFPHPKQVKQKPRTKPNQEIRAVKGKQDVLSNFYPTHLVFDKGTHKSAEHAYQVAKCRFFGQEEPAREIRQTTTASQAKSIASKWFGSRQWKAKCSQNPTLARLQDKWDKTNRRAYMKRLLTCKWDQCPAFKQDLQASGDATIIHNVPDKFWGTGSEDARNITGTGGANVFGKLLQELRQAKTHPATTRPTGPFTAKTSSAPAVPTKPSQAPKQARIQPPLLPATSKPSRPLTPLMEPLDLAPSDDDLVSWPIHEEPLPSPPKTPEHITEADTTEEMVVQTPSPDKVFSNVFRRSQRQGPSFSTPKPKTPNPQLDNSTLAEIAQLKKPTSYSAATKSPAVAQHSTPLTRGPNRRVNQPEFTPISGIYNRLDPKTSPAHVINFDGRNKTNWKLPEITTRLVIIGDSNIRRITNVPSTVDHLTTLISYSGMKFTHLLNILSKEEYANKAVLKVVISVGINNRADCLNAQAETLQKLIVELKNTFPKARLFIAEFGQTTRTKAEQQNLRDFVQKFREQGTYVLPAASNIKLADEVHWTQESANNMLRSWINAISCKSYIVDSLNY